MESRSLGLSVLYGVIAIFVLAIISSLIFSLLLTFTSLRESSMQYIVTTVSFISLFIGGFITGRNGKQKGWLIGGVTGLIYSIIIFLFQYLGHDSLFSSEQIIYHTCYILTAMMGAILGVNTGSSNSRN
ncbi:TIGR04086 family membrane protein [Mesobacillus maritimus]|uniref:TIGR04086 family membrane protein n=1 Tax=Mesobacillus maritimus TaxID=1643336 RepID=UPI00203B8EE6|nr:TIGR04086 family membrane protein [Mesobacillus maritimus]MCM3587697.1 TIGR04086 family membrane protein [Mesobacillus maritimus]MCM3669942.1 TIGR04086 family membrane protein [Mesobacillus maritimus]